ncbi:hypothetical protein [Salipiger mucosus]|uniref:hypothetical protein n=1 Tax=Salipiger mucosus TaxID=263378 RepID=UPI000374EE1D|nr:hypothetical protein [Salipiger mucosus]
MLLALGDICFGNLALGTIRVTQLDPTDAADRLAHAISSGDALGIFEFGAVPDTGSEKTFREVLEAISNVHGVTVPPEIFFSGSGEDDDPVFPLPPNLVQMRRDKPILLVTYMLERDEKNRASTPSTAPLPGTDREAVMDFLRSRFPTRVARDSLEFHFVELLDDRE